MKKTMDTTKILKEAAQATMKKAVSFHTNQGLQHNGYRYLREKEKARKQESERSK